MKKNWKNGLALLLALIMVLALAACGSSAQPSPDPSVSPAAESAEAAETKAASEAQPSSDPDTTAAVTQEDAEEAPEEGEGATLPEDGLYTTKEDVALYLHLYGHLPDNYITKKEAQALGWSGGSLEPFAPGCSIGGSRFGNYEGLLPEKDGRTYLECDIDTIGAKKRGAKRIVWSNDGLIYYTGDHYESFTLLYGEE